MPWTQIQPGVQAIQLFTPSTGKPLGIAIRMDDPVATLVISPSGVVRLAEFLEAIPRSRSA